MPEGLAGPQGEFVAARLPGGLDAWVWRRRGLQNRCAALAVRFGAMDALFEVDGRELEVPDGTAHFLEHKVFETEKGSALALFSRMGVRANAFISYAVTAYHFTATENFWPALRLLLGLVFTPRLTAEGVEAERRVIAQEIRMYEDDPAAKVIENLHRALYARHPVRRRIAGTVESISRITLELLLDCHRTFYHPSNAVFVAAGDLDPDRVFAEVAALVEDSGAAAPPPAVRRLLPPEPSSPAASRVEARMPVKRPWFQLGFKDRPPDDLRGEALLRREAAVSLAAEVVFGLTSPLRDRLYREGLLDEGFSHRYAWDRSFAHLSAGGTTEDPDRVSELLLEGISEWRQKGISRRELESKRRKTLGEYTGLFDSLEGMSTLFLLYRLKGTGLVSYPEVLGRVSLEEVDETFRGLMVPERASVSVVVPAL
ncbi:MAG TPA: hypothetical protein DGR79_01695 [Clostridiales bacterium]|nr:hypothetical protein [Clostridiales bacterium]